jgi:anthranilate synthase component I
MLTITITGGGIVFNSDETAEYEETLNKLGANIHCITTAEELYYEQQQAGDH